MADTAVSPGPRALSSMRHFLRDETRLAHDRLDRVFAAGAALRDPRRYAAFLRTMLLARRRFARELDAASRAAGLPSRNASALAALEADLAALGADVAAFAADGAPAPAPAPERRTPTSAARNFGVGYVFEGSALGARRLIGEAAEQRRPRAYLALVSEDAGGRWRRFVTALDAAGTDRPATRDAALAAFDATRRLAERCAHG